MPTGGNKNGNVRISDFNVAVARGLGGVLDSVKNQWYLPIDWYISVNNKDQKITRALILQKKPEPTHADFDLPIFVISLDNLVPWEERMQSPTVAYKLPASGATQVSAAGQLGWTAYEVKDQERPYRFYYTIECWGRYKAVAEQLLEIAMAKYPMRGKLVVTDSLPTERVYAVYQKNITDLTQVSSMVDRICGYSLSIMVEGELTSDRGPYTVPAFTGGAGEFPPNGDGIPAGYDEDGNPIDSNGNPMPGPGGLWGTGKPITRIAIVEDL